MSTLSEFNDGYIHAFTDGSYTNPKKRIGVGIVYLINGKTLELSALGVQLNQQHTNSKHRGPLSRLAEITAANIVMTQLPKGSRIFLHTDQIDIAQALKAPDAWLSSHNPLYEKNNNPLIFQAVKDLIELSQRHEIVETEVVNANITDSVKGTFMRMADALASIGSQTDKHQQQKLDISKLNAIQPISLER